MSLHRRAAKRDAAEPAIVSALEALGCVVWRVSGKGLPDLIVLRAGKKWLADVKGPKEKPTPAQEKAWEEAATKARCAVFILRAPEDAAKMLNNALQPWEPSSPAPGDNGHAAAHRNRKCACYPANNPPRKGDAATARTKECWCAAGLPCRHDTPANNQRLANAMNAYTPPRSAPAKHRLDCQTVTMEDGREPCTCGALDAAKEAEATFAPAEREWHGLVCERCCEPASVEIRPGVFQCFPCSVGT